MHLRIPVVSTRDGTCICKQCVFKQVLRFNTSDIPKILNSSHLTDVDVVSFRTRYHKELGNGKCGILALGSIVRPPIEPFLWCLFVFFSHRFPMKTLPSTDP